MKINLNYCDSELILEYNKKGILDYVIDNKTGKKLMVEYTQVGTGYELTKNNGFILMEMCNAVYVRIMELNIFVPKFIFIPNDEIIN